MRIIYQNDAGGVSVIAPSPEALALYGIEAIAQKDVPAPKLVWDVPTGTYDTDPETGLEFEVMGSRLKTYPYKIVEASDIPADRTFRAAWEVDEATLTDGVGGESNQFQGDAE